MKTNETETLYRKVGRKYVPVAARWYEDRGIDQMKAGTFRLTYAYTDGGRRYEYDVTPATAPMVAAMMVARRAIEETILDKARSRPDMTQYTKGQKKLIEKFRDDMGGMYPTWWYQAGPADIADAAMKAVMEFRP